jgi:hypothetical protein
MFLHRCGWHRKYHGHTKLLGVSSWKGWGITFSDGMCSDCSARVRAEWQLPAAVRPAPARGRRAFHPDFAFAAAFLFLGLVATFGIVVGPPRAGSERTRASRPSPAPVVVTGGVTRLATRRPVLASHHARASEPGSFQAP